MLRSCTLIGWVTGFLLLEDRDEGTLLALDVTPVGKSGFLLYRVGVTATLAVALTLYAWPLVIPEAIAKALSRCRVVTQQAKVSEPGFWLAQIRAHPTVDFPKALREMGVDDPASVIGNKDYRFFVRFTADVQGSPVDARVESDLVVTA